MLWKVRYQNCIFVGMTGGNRQEMLGGNDFNPASSRYFMHWKFTYSSTSKLWFRYRLIHGFSSIYTCTKTSQSHSPFITAGPNSSLRARGHVGCWVEFHPASLSEGWIIEYIQFVSTNVGETGARWALGQVGHMAISHHPSIWWLCLKVMIITQTTTMLYITNYACHVNLVKCWALL